MIEPISLQDRFDELKALMGLDRVDNLVVLGFRRHEARILCQLLTRKLVNNETILATAYNHVHVDERPEVGIVKVAICRIRAKLKPYGITIENLWGTGYSIREDNKDKLRRLMQ